MSYLTSCLSSKIDAVLNSDSSSIKARYLNENINIIFFSQYISEKGSSLNKNEIQAFSLCIEAEESRPGLKAAISRIFNRFLSCFGKQSDLDLAKKAYRHSVRQTQKTAQAVPQPQTKPSTVRASRESAKGKACKMDEPSIACRNQNVGHEWKLDETLKMIAQLDIDSPHFTLEIAKIIKGLSEQLKTASAEKSHSICLLIDCLKKLQDEDFFGPSPLEQKILKSFEKAAKKVGMQLEYEARCSRAIVRDLRKQLLRNLKTLNEEQLTPATIEREMQSLQKTAIERRLDACFANHPSAVELKLNILTVHAFLSKLETDYGRYYDDFKQEIYQKMDRISDGKFSKLIKFYDYIDLSANKEEFFNREIDVFLEEFVASPIMESMASIQSKGFKDEINKLYPQQLDRSLKSFIDYFDLSLSPAYSWIVKNISNFKKVYNQNLDVHRNCGEGICYQNCIERLRILTMQPDLPSTQIPMGSSVQGRFIRAKQNRSSNVSEADFKKLGVGTCREVVLHPPGIQKLVANIFSSPQIEKQAKNKKSFILVLHNAKGKNGHAINVQFDDKKGICRFIDDNLGVIELNNSKEFKTQLQEYLNAFYDEYDSFRVQFFDVIKN